MYALEINHLKKRYHKGVLALKNVDLKVKEKDFFGLLGPNGAGKTTMISIISSLSRADKGTAKVFGYDVVEDSMLAKQQIGIVPQEFNFNIFETAIDILINQGGYYGVHRSIARKRAEKYLKLLGLWKQRHMPSRNLSGGMKRRLMIARALMHEPRLLILDEPTAGIDIALRRSMWNFLTDLNESGISIILTTHYLEEAEFLCKNIAIIKEGSIIKQGKTQELINTLAMETFIFDLDKAIPENFVLHPFDYRIKDSQTIEVDLHKKHTLNEVMLQFDKMDIKVTSMRNKANRLEELFLHMLK